MFERGPMTMRLISPRSTAPYQTLDSSSIITSPIPVAPGTTHALEWMVGPFFKRAAIPACPAGSGSGSMCIESTAQHHAPHTALQGYGVAIVQFRITESDFLILAPERL